MARVAMALAAAVVALAVGCGGQDDAASPVPSAGPAPAPASEPAPQLPEVAEVTPTRVDGDVWSLEVTLRSPAGSPERYADGWRVLAPDGTVLGEQVLPFTDTGGQPVTRTQPHVRIPAGIDEITVEPSDSASGYTGRGVAVPLD